MDLADLLALLWRKRFFITGVPIVAALAGLLVAYITPDSYRASALTVVKPIEVLNLGRTGAESKEVLDLSASGSVLQIETPAKTYIEVIQSRAVAEEVVRALGLEKDFEEQGWAGRTVSGLVSLAKYGRVIELSPFEKAVDTYLKKISLATKKDTYLFEIEYVAKRPDRAADVANMAAERFVEYMVAENLREARADRKFLEGQLVVAESNRSNARNALKEFKEKHKSIDFDQEVSSEIEILEGIQSSLEKVLEDLAGAKETFGPLHPTVKGLEAERELLEERLTLRRAKLQKMPSLEARLSTLQSDLSNTEITADTLYKRVADLRMRETKKAKEISVVSAATPPQYPDSPIMIFHAGAGFMVGIILALFLVLFIDYRDDTLYTITDVEDVLGTPVISTIPMVEN